VNVLVDSSVWVAHFKQRDERLVALLNDGMVVCHPYIVMEIACGTPPDRRNVIQMLSDLEVATVATHDEVLTLIERQTLFGKGCGLVDLSLLASTLLSEHTQLWTLDARLLKVAAVLDRAYAPNLQH
jgi:predicted nucleic acid-binding protein